MSEKLVFVAKRTDGLGERLKAILHALALCKVYGAEFKFYWNEEKFNREGHAVDKIEKIFSSQFIHNHHVDLLEIPECKIIDDFLLSKKNGWYFCNQNISRNAFKNCPDDYKLYQVELKNAFRMIGFSDSIQKVIKKANSFDIEKDFVALHLRAGDVVYGGFYQSFSHTGKALSYPIALHVIREAKKNALRVLIFGQDVELIKKLSKMDNALSASEFSPENLGRAEAAFFDIILMSKCRAIHAGGSGFSVLASMINEAKYVNPMREYSKKEIVDIIFECLMDKDFFNNVSKEQLVFACKTALIHGVNVLNSSQRLALLDFGKSVAPNNLIFPFIEAWDNYLKGNVDEADFLIEYWMNNKANQFDKFVQYNFGTPNQALTFSRLFDSSIIKSYTDKPATDKLYKLLTKH